MERETDQGTTLGEQLGSRDSMLGITAAVQAAAKEHAYTTWWDSKPIYMTDLGRVEVWLDDGQPPDGSEVQRVSAFPPSPSEGDYALRVDFLPNRLFRYVSGKWLLREVDRKREWNNYNWTDALAGFMTDRTEEQDMRPWEYRSIHDVATARQDRFSPSPKSEEGYVPDVQVGSWEPMISYTPPSFGYSQSDATVEYSLTLPGGVSGAFLHPALEAPSGAYADFYVQYVARRSGAQEVGELVVNDTGTSASIRQESDSSSPVGITFSTGHSFGTRILRYTTTPGPSVTLKFRVRRMPNMSITGPGTINDIFEVAVPVVGKPDPDELLVVYTAANPVRLDASRCFGRTESIGTADSTFTAYRNGSPMVTFAFMAGQGSAIVTMIDDQIDAGDVITFRAPDPQDLTLADVGLVLGGFHTALEIPADGNLFELAASVIGPPDADEVILIYVAAHDAMIQESRSFGRALSPPIGTATFRVYKNGTQVMTATFGSGHGSAVVTLTDGELRIGDTLVVRAPITSDPSIGDVAITIGGYR
jgi:hypothetical protein